MVADKLWASLNGSIVSCLITPISTVCCLCFKSWLLCYLEKFGELLPLKNGAYEGIYLYHMGSVYKSLGPAGSVETPNRPGIVFYQIWNLKNHNYPHQGSHYSLHPKSDSLVATKSEWSSNCIHSRFIDFRETAREKDINNERIIDWLQCSQHGHYAGSFQWIFSITYSSSPMKERILKKSRGKIPRVRRLSVF